MKRQKEFWKKRVQTSYPYLTSFSFWLHPKKQLSKLREHHHGIKTQKKIWKYGKYCIYYGLAFIGHTESALNMYINWGIKDNLICPTGLGSTKLVTYSKSTIETLQSGVKCVQS